MEAEQPNTIEALVERYEALGTQTYTESMTTGPDESTHIGGLWDKEIERTKTAFRFTHWTLANCLNIRVGMLLQHDDLGNVIRDDGTPGPTVTDNRITRLIYLDEAQTLLSLYEVRNDYNAQVIQIARFALLSGTIKSLAGMVAFDNEYREEHPDAV